MEWALGGGGVLDREDWGGGGGGGRDRELCAFMSSLFFCLYLTREVLLRPRELIFLDG